MEQYIVISDENRILFEIRTTSGNRIGDFNNNEYGAEAVCAFLNHNNIEEIIALRMCKAFGHHPGRLL